MLNIYAPKPSSVSALSFMQPAKNDIINQLQKEILSLQGFKTASVNQEVLVDLGPINESFPTSIFPVGAIHEFLCSTQGDAAATTGFVAGVLASLMQQNGVTLWISTCRTTFPPALSSFGVAADQVIFIDLQTESDVLWAMEEALKCPGIAAVIGELPDISFTTSRRLQLAVEQSRVTGFILRKSTIKQTVTATVARWRIQSIPGETRDNLPGLSYPRWKVELLKVRNGKPGSWIIEWTAGRFKAVEQHTRIHEFTELRKIG